MRRRMPVCLVSVCALALTVSSQLNAYGDVISASAYHPPTSAKPIDPPKIPHISPEGSQSSSRNMGRSGGAVEAGDQSSAFRVLTETTKKAPIPSMKDISSQWEPVAKEASEGNWKAWARVIDALTGEVLVDTSGSEAHIPASTTKILTALTALKTLNPSDRLATGVSIAGSHLYLWGDGDLLLSAKQGKPNGINGHAGLDDLAGSVARELKARSLTSVTLSWNWVIFDGPTHLDAWKNQDVGDSEGSVGAFAINTGATTSGDSFNPEPGRDVAFALAEGLKTRGVEVDLKGEQQRPNDAKEIARVNSATIGQQIRYLLHRSDNTLADQYCRLSARAKKRPASFSGGIDTIQEVLTSFKIDQTGLHLEDCSGLSLANRISANTLTQVLRIPVTSQESSSYDLISDLPWAGYQGTVKKRLDEGKALANAQAKTGSLGSVSTLAGVVRTHSGRQLIFSLGSEDVAGQGAYGTRAPLDAFIDRLADL